MFLTFVLPSLGVASTAAKLLRIYNAIRTVMAVHIVYKEVKKLGSKEND
jgi:hypothetical protein